jgi:hypothetical protein
VEAITLRQFTLIFTERTDIGRRVRHAVRSRTRGREWLRKARGIRRVAESGRVTASTCSWQGGLAALLPWEMASGRCISLAPALQPTGWGELPLADRFAFLRHRGSVCRSGSLCGEPHGNE